MWRSSTPGPTNRHTVSSHDQDCHTAPLSATGPLTLNGAAFLLDHITRRSETRPRDALFFFSPPQKRTNFTTQPNSQWLASCSSMRANPHQHQQRESHSYFVVLRGTRASRFFFQLPSCLSSTFSILIAVFTRSSPSQVTPTNHHPQGAWPAGTKPGRWGFCLLGNV